MSAFVTGMTTCSHHPDVCRIADSPGATTMWVDVEERGQGLPGGVFPQQRDFDVVIYVVDAHAVGSTQMAAHFVETEFRISAGSRFVLPLDDVLENPRYVHLLKPISMHPRINIDEALRLCGESGGPA